MYVYTPGQWALLFFFYCFCGWVWESCYVSARQRQWVNRGFLHGPLLPIYGSGAIIILFVTLPVADNLWLVYVLGMLAATLLEYVVGAVMEQLFKVRYWDYTKQPCNLHGYICLTSSIAWGFFSILLVRFIHPPIDRLLHKLADLLDEYVFPLAFDGMPADDAEIILNPSGKFVQGGPDADTGLTGRKLMVDSYGTFAPHGGGAFSGKDATKVDRSGAYMARYIAKNIVAAGFAQRCQVTLAYAIGEKEPVMVDVNTFGTGICEDDCLSAAVRKAYDLTPAGIIKQLNLLNPIYSRTAAGGHFGREDFPWENIERMSDLAAYIV